MSDDSLQGTFLGTAGSNFFALVEAVGIEPDWAKIFNWLMARDFRP